MYYVDKDIKQLLNKEIIRIVSDDLDNPFSVNQIQSASIDLRLSPKLKKFKDNGAIEIKSDIETEVFELGPDDILELKPGDFLIGQTLEQVHLADNIVGKISGRSSISRFGISISNSADIIHPGYGLNIPLTINNQSNRTIKTTFSNIEFICQIVLSSTVSPTNEPYAIKKGSKFTEYHETPEIKIEKQSKKSIKTVIDKTEIIHAKTHAEKWRLKLKKGKEEQFELSKFDNKSKEENDIIGSFLRDFLGAPKIYPFEGRSSFREDSILTYLRSNLKDNYNILDLCCGLSNWLPLVETGNSKDINYVGLDGDFSIADRFQVFKEENALDKKFNQLQIKIRDISDLNGLPIDQFNLVLLVNSLHELNPFKFPKLFSEINNLIKDLNGKFVITDMEELPINDPESIAINWKGKELCTILKNSGCKAKVTTHLKQVNVFQLEMEYSPNFNGKKLEEEIDAFIDKKIYNTVKYFDRISSEFEWNPTTIKEWIKTTGLLARLQSVKLKMNSNAK